MQTEASLEQPLGWIWAFPLIALIMATGLSFGNPSPNLAQQTSRFGEGLRIVFYGGPYLLAGMLAALRAPSVFLVARRSWLYFAMILLALASTAWSFYPYKVAINVIHFVGLFLVAATSAQYCRTRKSGMFPNLVLVTAAILFLSLLVVYIAPHIGKDPILEGRWRGITSHPNTLGAICIIAIWASMMTLYTSSRRLLKVCALSNGLFAFLILLRGCRSMTSTLSTVPIIFCIPLLMSLKNSSLAGKILKISLLAVVGIGVLFILAIAEPQLLGYKAFLKVLGKSSTLTGRTDLWALAQVLIQKRMAFGWSFDSLASVLSAYKDTMAYGQFHNGYLDLAVRGGLTSLCILALILARCLRLAFREMRINYASGAGAMGLLLTTIVSNVAEASFFREGSTLWVLFVFSWACMEIDVSRARRSTAAYQEQEEPYLSLPTDTEVEPAEDVDEPTLQVPNVSRQRYKHYHRQTGMQYEAP